ncbi:hypothetical protein MKX01_015175, partial [Papaver californicum]
AVISGFSEILHQAVDFQITPSSFNMKKKVLTNFTVSSFKSVFRLRQFIVWISHCV